ncbi:carbohydrate ABC transporter permease [Nonomuraea jabiensis]|uniref:Multiple sugar transport system permease protein n=1 Tax=Nonomuraea jabiensis TaxID=882448 RepID=A0A7W9G0W2_9ACTN|nr:carbohydrate ABC transporter permease [Nonomuraea jabiensis]MBB5775087.1 multiple sugar transport system permease protein [Nonomuraea jabiensis]
MPTSRRWALHLLVVVGALVMLYPLFWLISSSFKPNDEIFTDPGPVPQTVVADNYATGWTALGVPFGGFFANSFIIAAAAVAGNVMSCSMAAFAFARLSFRFRKLWFAIMLVSIMLPIHVLIVPQYTLFKYLGWVDTFLPLIVPKFLAVDGFFIFLMVQFIRSLPRELDDAARIDGCGPVLVYWRIILPLSRPALITTAIFTFIWTWDDFFSQLVYLSDVSTYTVPLALRAFLDSSGGSTWGPMLAMAVLSLIPILGFFLIFQRRITEGISTTGLKG